MKTQKLFRPVGRKELELIIENNLKAYPPRLEWQPIFYPVLNYEYAEEIAVKWNLDDSFSDFCGFVTEFEIEKGFLSRYETQNVGNHTHNELWIPAENLAEFNSKIRGSIVISGRYYGENYTGIVENTTYLKNLTARQQLEKLKLVSAKISLEQLIRIEQYAILLNWGYWKRLNLEKTFLNQIKVLSDEKFATFQLK